MIFERRKALPRTPGSVDRGGPGSKRIVGIVVAAVLTVWVIGIPAWAAGKLTDHVDPFIGTGGHGHTFPGATLPFGMVQLSPDTRLEGWDGCSGYHDTDTVVYGFSHTHLSGTGISDYGDVLLMPVTGEPKLLNGHGGGPDDGYASRFDKSTESAGPGWYSVQLADYGVAVDLTATERAGFHRYTFPKDRSAHVVVDLQHRDRVVTSNLRIVNDREIEGHRLSTGWARNQYVYFVARFSRPFVETGLAKDDALQPDATEVKGKNVKGVLSFGDAGGEVLVKVGISAVDVDGARRNLDAEIPEWDFDGVRRAADRTWNDSLSRIEVSGGTEEQRTIFYTALYHSLLAPNVYSDVDDRYRGMDLMIHRTDGRRHYTVFSLWDTFRATHPLFTLIEPERTTEFVQTFLDQYKQGGRLPVWELAANETDTMIGYHAVPVIVDAWLKGIRGYGGAAALEAMLNSATQDHFGLEAYRRKGFIGSEDASESVSRTLEYAFDDACIARMADDLGFDETAEEFRVRSEAWRHVLDAETGFMRPRRLHYWVDPFDPRRVDNNYTEANAWQYSFFVPHDVPALIAEMGGDERFLQRLDELFTSESETTGRDQADITGMIGQYAHGNEPSHHMAWLYHYAGRPDLSNARVRQILDELYEAAPDGLSGNEDCGQMSSWYVLAAAGIYPVDPCSAEYALGSPIFDKVTIRPANGKRFTIRARAGKEGGAHVRSVELNGKGLQRSFVRHAEIAAGGDLTVELGTEPSETWGRDVAGLAASTSEGQRVLPAPFVRGVGDRFRGEATIELACSDPDAEIHYNILPAMPDKLGWQIYSEPLSVGTSARLQFYAERDGLRSPTLETFLHRVPHDWTVELAHDPSPQYTAGGADALIDGLRGGEDWRTGGWQGFQGTDFEATVDLQTARPLHHIGASFLQDVRSWIWMPSEVEVSVSVDGESFEVVGRWSGDVPDDRSGIVLREVVADLDEIEGRWVRIHARNYGTIPDWHPGKGAAAYIFVDELLID